MVSTLKGVVGAAVASIAVAAFAAAPADAATRVVTDPRGDASSARFDITRTTFHNGDRRISATAHVANLRYGGEQYFSVTLGPEENPDVALTVLTRLHSDGTLSNHMRLFNDAGPQGRFPCSHVRGIWRPESDRVKVSIPRSCIDGVTGRLYMVSHLGPDGRRHSQDEVNGHFVRQG